MNEYAQKQNLLLIADLDYCTSKGKTVRPDGTLKDALRLDWGYWESKDTDDDLEVEIEKKYKKGYPSSNILFEDSQRAILYQKGDIVGRCDVRNPKELGLLLTRFVSYTRSEVRDFRDAIEKFKEDLPQVLDTLRQMIEQQVKENKNFVAVRESFLELCKNVINENVELADVNEMLIQHILTEEIFTTVFDDPQFHQENNISKELQKLECTFFTGKTKRDTLDTIKIYYQMIKARAGEIANHTEKQKFLKVVYENFYKAYNPKAADRLGIIYTPDEIVKFMIESTDFLLHKHFGRILASKDVEILDPATGTG
ncbi:MAG: N-6 DNA methylase, partial [Sedimentisphaerales bacterium]|nr:N-6 DNA methylase [Sedimentisphaerales bacterium]